MPAMNKPAMCVSRLIRSLFLAVAVFLVTGCDLLTISQSGREIREGNDAVLRGEFQKAVEHYESALDGTLLTAEAHYRLGLLYEDKLKNQVAALHHFERYLELAPQGQFAIDVRGYVERLRVLIVSGLAEGDVIPAREAVRLKNENLELQRELASLRGQEPESKQAAARATPSPVPAQRAAPSAMLVGTPPPLPTGSTPEPEVRRALPLSAAVPEPVAAAATPTPEPAVAKSYTVVSGDTLSKISRKHYGNSSDWQKIAEANKEVLPDPAKLKPGMVLTIPPK